MATPSSDEMVIKLKAILDRTSVELAAMQAQQIMQQTTAQAGAAGAGAGAAQAAATQAAATQAATQATTQATQATQGFTISTQNLGAVGKYVWGTVVAMIGVQSFRQIIVAIQAAIQAGLDFIKTMYTLDVSIRAMQRTGSDIKLADVYTKLAEVQHKYAFYSIPETAQAMAKLAQLTTGMGLTQEQFLNLFETTVTVAIAKGKDLTVVSQGIALAMSSGWTRSVQGLGLEINKATIAMEAQRLGFSGIYSQLTLNQRALATYNLLMRERAKYEQDLAAYYRTAPGAVERMGASWTNLKTTAGQAFGEMTKIIATFVATSLDAWKRIIDNFQKIEIFFASLISTSRTFFADILKGMDFKSALADWQKAQKEMYQNIGKELRPDLFGGLLKDAQASADILKGMTEDEQQRFIDDMETTNNDLESLMTDSYQKREDAATKFHQDMARITLEGQRQEEELVRNHARKLSDIETKYTQDVQQAYRDYNRNILSDEKDLSNRRLELEQNHRNDELTAEEQFQEKMKELREQLSFDLEDAVRNRDPRSARNLIRRYNLQVAQDQRQYQLDKAERDRQFALELLQLNQQAIIRRQQRWLEYQQKLQDLALQRTQDIQDANIRFQQDQADLKLKLAQQRADRIKAYQQELQDINLSIKRRLQQIAEGWIKEFGLTKDALDKIMKYYTLVYGQNGYLDELFKYYSQRIAGLPAPGMGSTNNLSTGLTGQTVVPIGSVNATAGRSITTNKNLAQAGAGSMAIKVILDPNLQAQIIDKTLGQLSDVMVSVERARI